MKSSREGITWVEGRGLEIGHQTPSGYQFGYQSREAGLWKNQIQPWLSKTQVPGCRTGSRFFKNLVSA